MTVSEKQAWIEKYEQGAGAFDDTLSMEPALLTFRPTADAWSIHEQVVHFFESDVAAFHRYRKAVAEPSGPAVGYDEEKWTPALGYHATSLADAVSGIKLLRKIAAVHLRSIVAQDWSKFSYTHSSYGPVSLESWLESYVDHVRFHRELVDRNIRLFRKG